MTRWHGKVGYAFSVDKGNGIVVEEVVEREYYGDIFRNTRNLQDGEKVNNDLSVSNHISIVADAYASEHFIAIRYLTMMGVLWEISEVEVQSPRLVFRLGGVYNGERPDPVPDTP